MQMSFNYHKNSFEFSFLFDKSQLQISFYLSQMPHVVKQISTSGALIEPLRFLITFSGDVRKMFHTRVIFGGTMDNYISMERL